MARPSLCRVPRPCRLRPPLSCATRGRTRGASLADVEGNRVLARPSMFFSCRAPQACRVSTSCTTVSVRTGRVRQRTHSACWHKCRSDLSVVVFSLVVRVCASIIMLPRGACDARVRLSAAVPSIRPSGPSAAAVCSAGMHALRHFESDGTARRRRTGMIHTPGHHPSAQQSLHYPLWIGPQPLPCMSHAHRQPQHTGTPLLLPHTHFAFCCPCTLRDGAHGHAGVGQNAKSPLHSHCVRARLRLPRLLCCGHAHQAHTHKRSPKHSHFGKCGDPSRSAQPQRPPAAAPTRPWPAPTPGATFSPPPPSAPLRHGA